MFVMFLFQAGSIDELFDKSVTESLDGEDLETDTVQEDFRDNEDFVLLEDGNKNKKTNK